ncbi:MAG: molybdopterin-dependent oxidoreductase, partial [Chloroflexi bacterium]|nr:molybdopterin-dependent oxidoreductase [Chloroflexota bacterium]
MVKHQSFTRREFLKVSTGVVGGATFIGSARALAKTLANENSSQSNNQPVDEQIIPTVCLLCPSGCGMLARVVNGNLVKVEGSPMHPINQGALCPKGQAAPELLYNPDRLTGPMRRVGERGADRWESITWEEAIQTVAGNLNHLRAAGHPERAAVLYGEVRGQMRAFLERFMAAIGSPNAISHDSLNIDAAKLGTLLTQGIYDLPAYDLENSHYILSFGANILEAGRSPQRMVSGMSYMRRGRAERGKVVVFDP